MGPGGRSALAQHGLGQNPPAGSRAEAPSRVWGRAPLSMVWGREPSAESGAEPPRRVWGRAPPRRVWGRAPSRVRGRPPAGNALWSILKVRERSFVTYMLMLWVRQTVFHVTFGGKAEIWGRQLPLPQRRTAPDFIKTISFQSSSSAAAAASHLHLLESTLVVITPRQTLGSVLLFKTILHFTRSQEQIYVCQVLPTTSATFHIIHHVAEKTTTRSFIFDYKLSRFSNDF